MLGRVFMGWINTKPRINVSLKDTTQWLRQWIYSNQQPFDLQTNALPTEWAAALCIYLLTSMLWKARDAAPKVGGYDM